jgi:DNA-binding NtrC family response regulator
MLEAIRSRVPRALLIAEGLQTPSCLARRLEGQGCSCSFARSYREACSSLGNQDFDLVLSPLRLRGVTLFPLVDLLEASKVTLFYSYPVEQGCWWLPALRRGQKCFGSAAFRPSKFVSVVDEVIDEVWTDRQVGRGLQKPAQQSARSVLTILSSRNEPALPPVRPRADLARHTLPKRLAR